MTLLEESAACTRILFLVGEIRLRYTTYPSLLLYEAIGITSGEMTELAEGARLEIVCAPKAYLGFESLSLRQMNPKARQRNCSLASPKRPAFYQVWSSLKRRGGRVVECGGLENRFTGIPGDEGSNPSSSASFIRCFTKLACLFLPSSSERLMRQFSKEIRFYADPLLKFIVV